MKYLLILFLIGIWNIGLTKTYRIGLVDTGYDFKHMNAKLCPDGHQDFTNKGLQDINGHGTFLANLLTERMGRDLDYCIVMLKYWHVKGLNGSGNEGAYITRAYRHLIKNKDNFDALILTLSGENEKGFGLETVAVTLFLNNHKPVMAAAGNDSLKLEWETTERFPAMSHEKVIVVGSVNIDGKLALFSNYGNPVDTYEIGQDVISIGLNNQVGKQSGTSVSVVLFASKFLQKVIKNAK